MILIKFDLIPSSLICPRVINYRNWTALVRLFSFWFIKKFRLLRFIHFKNQTMLTWLFFYFFYSLISKNRTTRVEQFVFWFTNKSRLVRFIHFENWLVWYWSQYWDHSKEAILKSIFLSSPTSGTEIIHNLSNKCQMVLYFVSNAMTFIDFKCGLSAI